MTREDRDLSSLTECRPAERRLAQCRPVQRRLTEFVVWTLGSNGNWPKTV